MSDSDLRIAFVSGMSGSGKSTAMAALEDLSFYCVDNLPVQLIEQFLHLCKRATTPIRRIALAIDARESTFLRELPAVVAKLRESGASVDVIFLECSTEILINRYSETRRIHPFSPGGSVEEGIEKERQLLIDLAGLADHRIDTSTFNVHQIKAVITARVSGEARSMVVNVISFGFRFGAPPTAELLFDVRFLPNPYFEERLRDRTGRDREVAEYVLKSPSGAETLDRLSDLCEFLLPLYDEEGKAYLTIGVGCTGGQHRSVVIADSLAGAIRKGGREVNVEHRDVERNS